MKFDVIKPSKDYCSFHGYGDLIQIGEIHLQCVETNVGHYMIQSDDRFNYYDIDRALCGELPYHNGDIFFGFERLLVIEMKF